MPTNSAQGDNATHASIVSSAQSNANARCPGGQASYRGPYGPDVNAVYQGWDRQTFESTLNNPANWHCYGGGGGGGGGGGAAPAPSGGGGGGGGGGNFSSSASYSRSPEDDAFLARIRQTLEGIFSGQDVPFSQDTVSDMGAHLIENREAERAAARRAIQNDLVQRGLSRSGIATDLIAEADQGAFQRQSQGRREIAITAVKENFAARERALENAANFLAQREQYLLQSESNATARELGLSQIKLGYARIQSEMQIARENYANQIRLAELGLIGQGVFGGQYS